MKENNEQNIDTSHTIDNAGINVSGHILIRDKDTGEELINKRFTYKNIRKATKVFDNLAAFVDSLDDNS